MIHRPPPSTMRRILRSVLLLLGAAALAGVPMAGQTGAANGEWRYYGADAGSTKYSPLDQIDKDNVKDLRIAWRWHAENLGPRPEYNLEATPLMVGGVLYTTAGSRRNVAAIDGATGETLWLFRFDEGERGERAPRQQHRGVAYWTDGAEERILYITPGYQLIALDAKSGRPISSFGRRGVVDLYEELDRPNPKPGMLGSSSPPIVVKDVVVVGTAGLASVPTKENTAAPVRGYDVRSGKRLWTFHTIPRPGELGNETWENDSWSYTGNTGVWAPISADEELGYVYLPVETPTNDFYGGDRLGDNLFANSLVCLDARSGRRVWHFQFVHHDIWDMDTPAPPVLLDITVDGRPIKAIAQVTKQAFTYVLDRVSGKPVWPIEERPVPQSDVPGERTALTQPFPTKPPPFDRQGVTEDDLIDFTPALRAEALEIVKSYRTGPLFTPPIVAGANGLIGTLHLPNWTGGANWQGGAADPETGMLYVASATSPSVGSRRDPNAPPPARAPAAAAAPGQAGSARTAPPPRPGSGPQGLPLIKPPYGRITAIDLNKGELAWTVANGPTPDAIKNHPSLKGLDIPETGKHERSGLIVTRTLLFAGEGAGLFGGMTGGGPLFRALDKQTGQVVAELTLPARQTGIPMTYMVNGRQFIVIAVGAQGVSAQFVALALP
jgi:quinoprotein glucose dehydrogenase